MSTVSRVRVKICGVTVPADAELAARLGADAVGINFYPGSPRFVTAERANEIAAGLPPFVEPVALFVNCPASQLVEESARFSWLRTVQWHTAGLPDLPEAPIRCIVAAPIRDAGSVRQLKEYLSRSLEMNRLPAAVLLDAHVPGMYGGTGRTAPWELLRDLDLPSPIILAGGLTPDNVAEAIRTVRPYAVDVAGGVESAPGRKDPERLRRFLDEARSA